MKVTVLFLIPTWTPKSLFKAVTATMFYLMTNLSITLRQLGSNMVSFHWMCSSVVQHMLNIWEADAQAMGRKIKRRQKQKDKTNKQKNQSNKNF